MKKILSLFVTGSALALLFLAVAVVMPSPAQASAGYCYQNGARQCISNIAYIYDSCGNIQAVGQNCNKTNQLCQNGYCVNRANTQTQTNPATTTNPGYVQGTSTTNNTTTTNNNTTTTTSQNGQVAGAQTQNASLVISLFGKKASDAMQLEKYIDATNNDQLEFVVTVKNTSAMTLNDVNVTANLTNNISYTGNLKIDNTTSAGSITTGISLGTLAPNTSKAMTFTGTVQTATAQAIQVSAAVNSGVMHDADYITVNVPANSSLTAAVSTSGNAFVDFIKKWYLWVIIIIVLIILFVIIFRRLSTNP